MKIAVGIVLVLFAAFAQAQQCGTYTGAEFINGFGPPDKGFKQDPDIILPPENTALALTVTGPLNKAVVGTRTIQVYGTFAGPPAAGVAINRVPAVQTESNYVGMMVLKPGVNSITVKITKLTGESETITRSVTYDPNQAPDVDFISEILGEHHPIRPRFYIKPKAGLTITRVQLDFDGDNINDLDAASVPGNLRFEYKLPGFYNVSAIVNLDDGNPLTPIVERTVTRRFAVVPLPLTRKTLCYVFYRMKDRLVANDIAGALKSLNAELRPEWQEEFDLIPNLTIVGSNFGVVVDGKLGIRLAELEFDQVTAQWGRVTKSMTFERSLDGVWRITSM